METRQIFILTLLVGSCMDASNGATIVTVSGESHHVDNGRCENMRAGLSLNLRDVGLRRVSSGFANSSSISCLNLEDNQIVNVSSSAFNLLPNLRYLNLARNHLSLTNFSKINGHAQLRTLVLDENSFDESVTLQFSNNFPNLAYLYIRNCSIGDIASLAFAPKLVYLNLSENNLGESKLNFLEDVPVTLKTLDLSKNAIENFNASSLFSVQRLRLDANKFQRLCGKPCDNEEVLVLEGATSLQWFSASNNALASVDSDAFDTIEALEHLDLSHNKIDSIQKGTFEQLDDLLYLSLEGNLLKTIPELCNLESLKYLSLAKNYLSTVNRDAFCQIENLTFVDLSDNRIRAIQQGAFDKLTRLEVLKLSNNLITNFPSSWLEHLKYLRSLHVDGNGLKSLSDLDLGSLNMFAKLERVYAQNNLIHNLYTGSVHSEVRNKPNVTIVLFDHMDKSQKLLSSEEACRWNCYDDNEVSF